VFIDASLKIKLVDVRMKVDAIHTHNIASSCMIKSDAYWGGSESVLLLMVLPLNG